MTYKKMSRDMTQQQADNSQSLFTPYAQRTADYYLRRLDPAVFQSLNQIQLKEIERVLREATPQPLPKIIDLRFTLDLIVSKFYIVLLAGKDQRRSPRKHPISNRVTRIGNTTAVIILLLAINLLISVVIIVAVYLLKTIIGIDLTSGGHFSDYIKEFGK